jgi:hypothetical protein
VKSAAVNNNLKKKINMARFAKSNQVKKEEKSSGKKSKTFSRKNPKSSLKKYDCDYMSSS